MKGNDKLVMMDVKFAEKMKKTGILFQDKGEFGSVSGKIEVDLKINHEGEVCLISYSSESSVNDLNL